MATNVSVTANLTSDSSVAATGNVDYALPETVAVIESLLVSKTGFFVRAISSTRFVILFGTMVANDATLLNVASYQISAADGTPLTITGVQAASTLTYVTVTVSAPFEPTKSYVVEIQGAVLLDGASLAGQTAMFQWTGVRTHVRIPLSNFSGEAQGGLLGNPLGLLFFSPSFEAPAPSSSIQLDKASVCTKSYDTYELPQPIDPPALYTFVGLNGVPTTTLNGAVLWAPHPRLSDARIEPTLLPTDTFGPYISGPATATFNEFWDPNYVSLLNNSGWKLFDNGANPPLTFITANNLAPIPAGGTTTVTLE